MLYCLIFVYARQVRLTGIAPAPRGTTQIEVTFEVDGIEALFNLTLRVTTRSILSRGCVAPGSVVEVSYAGVPLARRDDAAGLRQATEDQREGRGGVGHGGAGPRVRARRPRGGRAARGAGVRRRGPDAGDPRQRPRGDAGVVQGSAGRGTPPPWKLRALLPVLTPSCRCPGPAARTAVRADLDLQTWLSYGHGS